MEIENVTSLDFDPSNRFDRDRSDWVLLSRFRSSVHIIRITLWDRICKRWRCDLFASSLEMNLNQRRLNVWAIH